MAVLSVAEFCAMGGSGNFNAQVVQVPPLQHQTVVIGGSSTPCTNAFRPATNVIRISVNADCYIAFGTAPVATDASMFMFADTVEYFAVPAGHDYKVAVLEVGA